MEWKVPHLKLDFMTNIAPVETIIVGILKSYTQKLRLALKN